MRKRIELTPRKLLREESRHSGELTELRKRRTVAERIGKPERIAILAESRFEVTLSVEKLARE